MGHAHRCSHSPSSVIQKPLLLIALLQSLQGLLSDVMGCKVLAMFGLGGRRCDVLLHKVLVGLEEEAEICCKVLAMFGVGGRS